MSSPRTDAGPGARPALQAAFAPGGALAAHLPGFQPRACQVQMAEFVDAALEAGRPALVEAGTGTGKSMAYLIPALRASGQVIVSTATKALQHQLWEHDLPVAQRVAGSDQPVALLKGRANYLCLLSLDEQLVAPELELAQRVPRVLRWVDQTSTGDLDELGDDATSEVRLSLGRGTDTCEGRLCRFHGTCWAEKARARADVAKVIVTNHALLFADAKLREGGDETGVLPKAKIAILDEAHTVEDAATSAYTAELDANRAGRVLNARRVRDALARQHARTFSEILAASTAVFRQLDGALRSPRMRIVAEIPAGLRLARHAQALQAAAADVPDRAERTWVERHVRELALDVTRVFGLEDPGWVHYAERDERRGVVARAAPIAVDQLFARDVASVRLVIGTSATLTVDRSFEYVKARLGLHGAEALITDPAFDYARQALLFIHVGVPAPPAGGESSESYDAALARAISELVRASRGRAFCLFTSHRALNATWQRVAPELPYPVFRQGDAPPAALLAGFRRAGNGVLFGTRSFWEGVDVRGEALSLVIIARLPFAVPDDPVVSARTERLRAEGLDWFGQYALPRAVLLLKQGFGRLIRASTDRGVVAILDSRVARKAYGRTVIDSLPPARVTFRLEDVRAFFAEG
ncbi:MAG: ATP-dependent DNA helicase [Actinobacteria bacterium]|nr:ATP-dependent DNA helicase [Actinomycetota bacterium]